MPMTNTGNIAVSFRGVEADQIFLEPIFHDENILSLFRVMPNVPYKRKMLFAGALDDYLRQRTGCGFKPVGNFAISERCVETTMVKGEVEQCFDEFVDTVLMEALNKGVRMGDLSGTIMAQILLNRMQQGAQRQIMKLAFFGDKANVTDPSVNFVDGLWTVYIPQLVSQNLTPRITAAGGAPVSGTPLGAGDAIDLLDQVMDGATNELKAMEMGRKRLIVSNNIFEQLEKDIRNGATGSAAFIQELENGRTSIRFRNVQVIPMYRWEGLASQYMGTVLPGVTSDFNLVLYTVVDNLILATDMASDMNSIDTWFEKMEEKYLARTAFKLGFNYVHPSLMCVAY